MGKITLKQWSMIFKTNDGSQDTELIKAIKSLRCQNAKSETGVYSNAGKKIKDVANDMDNLGTDATDFDLRYLSAQIIAEAVCEGNNNKETYIVDNFRVSTNTWLSERVKYILENGSIENFF